MTSKTVTRSRKYTCLWRTTLRVSRNINNFSYKPNKKNTSISQFIIPNLVNRRRLLRIRCKSPDISSPKRLTSNINFFAKRGKFRIPYFHEFATDSYETSNIYYNRLDTSSGEANFVLEWKKIVNAGHRRSGSGKMLNDQDLPCCLGCLAISESILWIYIERKFNKYRVIVCVFLTFLWKGPSNETDMWSLFTNYSL